MHYCWITMRVSDLERSVKFYNKILHLPMSSRYQVGNRDIAMLGDMEKPNIELICENDNKKIRPNINTSVSILVESLEKTLHKLHENNIKLLRGPINVNNQITQAHLLDPDGYEVILIESL